MYTAYTAYFVNDLNPVVSIDESVGITETLGTFDVIMVAVDETVTIMESVHGIIPQAIDETIGITETVGQRGPDHNNDSTVGISEAPFSVLGDTPEISELINITETLDVVLGFPESADATVTILEDVGFLLDNAINTGNSGSAIFLRRRQTPWLN